MAPESESDLRNSASKPGTSETRDPGDAKSVAVPVSEAYELLELRILERSKEKLRAWVVGKLRFWGWLAGAAAVVLTFLGYPSLRASLKSEVTRQVVDSVAEEAAARLSRVEQRLDESWESGIEAKTQSHAALQDLRALAESSRSLDQNLQEQLVEFRGELQMLRDQASRQTELLASQSKQLETQRQLLEEYSSLLRTEIFTPDDIDGRMLFVPQEDRTTVIVFRLQEVPIEGSVRIQYSSFPMQPEGYVVPFHNIVYFRWYGSQSFFESERVNFYIFFTADPSRREDSVSRIELREDGLYGDGARLAPLEEIPLPVP